MFCFWFEKKLEGLGQSYYKAILGDVDSMLNRYTEALKNLPIVSSGTNKLKQTTTEIISQFSTVWKVFKGSKLRVWSLFFIQKCS